jgi:hypothetical protein
MPSNLQNPPGPTDRVKHLFLETEEPGVPGIVYSPYFYAEARIDFNDVRTGLRETISLSKALEIYSNNADLLWIDDMIRDVDPQKTSSSAPDTVRLGILPDFVDANFISRMETQFTQYLMRSFVTRLYRNPHLNVYSFSGESQAEFSGRCLELFDGPKRKDLDLLHDVFNRRLEQLKEKYLGVNEPAALEQAKAESQNKNVFFHYSERIAEFFMRGEVLMYPVTGAAQNSRGMQELEEQLVALEQEARQAATRLRDSYEEKARSLDEYLLHPNLKDIHFVRSCILWMPQKPA